MARILFIENREKTQFWQHVALKLQSDGNEIAWIVQNPVFRPRLFDGNPSMCILPFPPTRRQAALNDNVVTTRFPSLVSDRGRRYFGAGHAHYSHYTRIIQDALELLRPDLVVGESTLFHELIAIDLCRSSSIPYIHPCATRYPSGRFSVFEFDTQFPAVISNETWPPKQIRELVKQIASGKEIPSYMRKPGSGEKIMRKVQWGVTRSRVWWGRLRGERFNTPSLRRKIALAQRVRANLKRWSMLARLPLKRSRTLLYPMQLEPEANINVWGYPHSDQIAVIKEMLSAAPIDIQVALKANPKAKYELSDELLELASLEPRICLLPLGLSMTEAYANSLGAVTVSGTVGYEAVVGRGRCISLRHPLIERLFPLLHADTPTKAVERLLNEPGAGLGGDDFGYQFIEKLISQSFRGIVSDPLSSQECLERENIERVASAIGSALVQMKSNTAELVAARVCGPGYQAAK